MNPEIPEFLKEMLEKQYGKQLTNQIVQGYKVRRHVTFRVNTIKSTTNEIEENLKQQNIEYEKINWYENAFIIKNTNGKEIRNLEIYKNGKIYMQSLSSMLPPIILEPKPSSDILDMAAAPGGKTTQIAAITNNKANITACEMNKIRYERLKYNIEKQGANVYTMLQDARNIDDFFSFDQILLDAPCSGSGTLNINNNLKETFTKKLIDKSVKNQTILINKAINILKEGKEMIYSTCSILEAENENIVQKLINNKKIEIIPIKFNGMEQLPLLPTKIAGTLCICPNELYEGFFVAKIRKKK